MIKGPTVVLARLLRQQIVSVWTAVKLRLIKCFIFQETANRISPGWEHHLIKKLNWYQAHSASRLASKVLPLASCCTRFTSTGVHARRAVGNPEIKFPQTDLALINGRF